MRGGLIARGGVEYCIYVVQFIFCGSFVVENLLLVYIALPLDCCESLGSSEQD